MSDWRIPLSDLDYGADEEAAVARVLKSRWLSMGPEVQAFEREFSMALGVKHAIAVANGTAALHLSSLALGFGPGDEVVQPAINFVAAANTTVAVGATPVFADIVGVDEPTLDPEDFERQITPRTKAVIVMHYGGYLCRMSEILEIARRRGLAVIEDACHAVGARYLDPQGRPPHGQMAGSLGDIAAFSFFSNKNLAVGEGGIVTTNRDDLAERVRLYRSHGMTTLTWDRHKGHASSYEVALHGFNYRLDELRAALGRAQLEKLAKNNALRMRHVSAYRRHLQSWPGWAVPFANYRGDGAYHLMVVVLPDEDVRARGAAALREAGIQTSMHYPCIPDFEAFRRFQVSGLERSRSFATRAMTLPLFPHMLPSHVEAICSRLQANETTCHAHGSQR